MTKLTVNDWRVHAIIQQAAQNAVAKQRQTDKARALQAAQPVKPAAKPKSAGGTVIGARPAYQVVTDKGVLVVWTSGYRTIIAKPIEGVRTIVQGRTTEK